MQAGWGSARLGSFAGVADPRVDAIIERRSRDPVVPFGIFASRAARRTAAVTYSGPYISVQFLVTR